MLPPWPTKDPNEVLDFDINWLPRLTNQVTGVIDTIATSNWTIVSGTGLTINTTAFTPSRTKVWLAGGTLGTTYLLSNAITTAAGDSEIETVKIRIKAK